MPWEQVWVSSRGRKGTGKGKGKDSDGGNDGKGHSQSNSNAKRFCYCSNRDCPEYMLKARCFLGNNIPKECKFCDQDFILPPGFKPGPRTPATDRPNDRSRPQERVAPAKRTGSGGKDKEKDVKAAKAMLGQLLEAGLTDKAEKILKDNGFPVVKDNDFEVSTQQFRQAKKVANDLINKVEGQRKRFASLVEQAEQAQQKMQQYEADLAIAQSKLAEASSLHAQACGLDRVIDHRVGKENPKAANYFGQMREAFAAFVPPQGGEDAFNRLRETVLSQSLDFFTDSTQQFRLDASDAVDVDHNGDHEPEASQLIGDVEDEGEDDTTPPFPPEYLGDGTGPIADESFGPSKTPSKAREASLPYVTGGSAEWPQTDVTLSKNKLKDLIKKNAALAAEVHPSSSSTAATRMAGDPGI